MNRIERNRERSNFLCESNISLLPAFRDIIEEAVALFRFENQNELYNARVAFQYPLQASQILILKYRSELNEICMLARIDDDTIQ